MPGFEIPATHRRESQEMLKEERGRKKRKGDNGCISSLDQKKL
jgi:hypothetical protein